MLSPMSESKSFLACFEIVPVALQFLETLY